MNRLRTCLAVAALGIVAPQTIGLDAGELEAQTPAVTRLERLEPSELLLKPPQGLPGGFAIARTAPEVDFAVFPGQFSGARLWSSWGDVLAASDGRFYAAIGDHDETLQFAAGDARCAGVLFADLDNDGALDLVGANQAITIRLE